MKMQKTLFIIGLVLFFLPFLGFPTTMDTILLVLLGVGVILISVFNIVKRVDSEESIFVENIPEKDGAAEFEEAEVAPKEHVTDEEDVTLKKEEIKEEEVVEVSEQEEEQPVVVEEVVVEVVEDKINEDGEVNMVTEETEKIDEPKKETTEE